MRRLVGAVVAVGCLATASPALAEGEIAEQCGLEGISLPDLVGRDAPHPPWLDICGADVRGVPGNGPLRAVSATLHLEGDTANRGNSAAYELRLFTDRCVVQLQHIDAGPGGGALAKAQGYCDATSKPCELPPLPNCFTSVAGDRFDVTLPASATKIESTTATFSFDPNALPASAPQALREAFAAGRSLTGVGAQTYLTQPTDDGPIMMPVDEAEGEAAVALGG